MPPRDAQSYTPLTDTQAVCPILASAGLTWLALEMRRRVRYYTPFRNARCNLIRGRANPRATRNEDQVCYVMRFGTIFVFPPRKKKATSHIQIRGQSSHQATLLTYGLPQRGDLTISPRCGEPQAIDLGEAGGSFRLLRLYYIRSTLSFFSIGRPICRRFRRHISASS